MDASFFRNVFRFPVVLLVLCAPAAATRGAIFLTQDIVDNDSKVYAQNFPQVGYLYVHSAMRGWQGGSGTYGVNNKTVVTAAHVLAGDDGVGGGIDEVRFYTGPSVAGYTGFAYADHWSLHPQYVPNGLDYGDFDLAIVSLKTRIVGLAPAPLYTGSLSVGMQISAVGFGVPGTNVTGQTVTDQVLRAGTNVISGFGGDGSPLYSTDHPNFSFVRFADFASGITALEWQGSPGDSGGGWFVGNELAAVNSFIYGPISPGSVIGNSTGAVQIGLFQTWINDMAATSVPEPSSAVFCVPGAFMLILAARWERQSNRREDEEELRRCFEGFHSGNFCPTQRKSAYFAERRGDAFSSNTDALLSLTDVSRE